MGPCVTVYEASEPCSWWPFCHLFDVSLGLSGPFIWAFGWWTSFGIVADIAPLNLFPTAELGPWPETLGRGRA